MIDLWLQNPRDTDLPPFNRQLAGSGVRLARPERNIPGATSEPRVDSIKPQRCTFRPSRAAVFNRRQQGPVAAILRDGDGNYAGGRSGVPVRNDGSFTVYRHH
jgi:hypothetical protein